MENAVGYGGLDGIMSLIHATVPNIALLMKQLIEVTRSFHTSLYLDNISFCSFLSAIQDQLALMVGLQRFYLLSVKVSLHNANLYVFYRLSKLKEQ